MSVYYYEGSLILAPLTIQTNQPVFSADTVSLKHIRTAQKAQRWEISFTTLTSDAAADSLIAACDPHTSSKTMVMPQLPEVSKATTLLGNYNVASNANKGDTTVVLDTSSVSGTLPKGSFIKFSNHEKLYLLKNSISSSAGATTNLDIYPALVVGVTTSATLKYGNDTTLNYYRSIDNLKGLTYTDGVLSNVGNIDLLEAL